MDTTTVNDRPAVTFDYDVDDYATILLENPQGEVVNEARIEPDENRTALYMGEPQAGEYSLILRRGGETISTSTAEFEGAEAEITSIRGQWEQNELVSVRLSVQNSGELPLLLGDAEHSVGEQKVETRVGDYAVAENESTDIDLGTKSYSTISIQEAGEINGGVSLETSAGVATGTFTKTIEPAEFVLTDTDANWDGTSLRDVHATIRNEGDLTGEYPIKVEVNGEVISERNVRVQAGERAEVTPYDGGSITAQDYTAASGGKYTTTVTIEAKDGPITGSNTIEFSDIEGDIKNVEPSFYNAGYETDDIALSNLNYEVDNDGEIPITYDRVRVSMNGETRTEERWVVKEIETEGTHDITEILTEPIVVSPGSYEVQIELMNGNEVVLSETTTISAE